MLTKTSQLKIIKIIRFITAMTIAVSIFSVSFYFYIFYPALSGLGASSGPEEYAYRFAFIIFGVFLLVPPLLLIIEFTLTRNLNTKINKDIKASIFQKIILAIMTILDIFVLFYVIKFIYHSIA